MTGAVTPLLQVRIGRAIRQVGRMAIEDVPEQVFWNDRLMANLGLSVLIAYHVIPVFHPSKVYRIAEHTTQSRPGRYRVAPWNPRQNYSLDMARIHIRGEVREHERFRT